MVGHRVQQRLHVLDGQIVGAGLTQGGLDVRVQNGGVVRPSPRPGRGRQHAPQPQFDQLTDRLVALSQVHTHQVLVPQLLELAPGRGPGMGGGPCPDPLAGRGDTQVEPGHPPVRVRVVGDGAGPLVPTLFHNVPLDASRRSLAVGAVRGGVSMSALHASREGVGVVVVTG